MKKILATIVACLCLSTFVPMVKADSTSTSGASSGLTMGNIMTTIGDIKTTTEIKSEGKAQPPSVQELNFLYPMSLFVNAFDFRNIMDIIAFIHKHPAPYRWQLEKWAEGSSSDIIISSLNGETTSKSPYDQIVFTIDVSAIAQTLNSIGKSVSEANHMGSGTGNTTSAKVISDQNLCRFALAAIDRGHNIIEVKAQVIAEQVQGSASGFALGGGMSNVNNGGTAISIPAIIGYARGKAGKVGLEGIQTELYYKSVISFEEDAAKTRAQIEEIWRKQKEAAKEKDELNQLRRDAEKEKLQFEKKKYELEREKASRELEVLKKPAPPKLEAAPPKVEITPPAPKPEEALKKAIEGLKEDLDAIKEELKKQKEAAAPPVAPPLAPAPKPKAKKEAAARAAKDEHEDLPVFSILFDFDSAELKLSEKIKIVRAAGWLKEHPEYKLQLEGHCSKEGSYDYNATLGWKRANRVYNALMAAGASNNTIRQKVSVSKDRPVSGNEPENRRVILRAIGQASEKAKKKVL